MQIRDNKYYRETHGTFELYCKERWNLKRTRAYELIEAAEVAENLSEISNKPILKESHMAKLAELPPDKQKEVYEEAVKTAPDGKVTAEHIEDCEKGKRHRYRDIMEPGATCI